MLVSQIKKINPEVVFLHAGEHDVRVEQGTDALFDNYKQLIWKLLESTSTKICISLIIPVLVHPDLNELIMGFNNKLTKFITDVRRQRHYKNRIYTCSNDSLAVFMKRSVEADGVKLSLSVHGERRLWLRLRDSISTALDINAKISSRRDRSHSSTSHSSLHHE